MTDDASDPVAEALMNLKQRRDELDRAISALERIRLPGIQFRHRTIDRAAGVGSAAADRSLTGMSLGSAIITVLETAGRPLGNSEIVEGLMRGGMQFRGTNPPLAVAQGLSRLAQKPGAIQKLARGRWAVAAPSAVPFAMASDQRVAATA